MTLDQIVAAVQAQNDATVAQVQQWANDRQRRMVAESLWRGVIKDVATTVAEQAMYPVEDDMVDLRALMVDGALYGEASVQQLWQVTRGRAFLRGDGVYAPSFDADGTPQIELFPVPSVDGLSVTALMAYEPPTMVSGSSPVIPIDMHHALVDGCFADALLQMDGRTDLMGAHEANFAAAVQELARRRLSRIGSGPVQARVAGYQIR